MHIIYHGIPPFFLHYLWCGSAAAKNAPYPQRELSLVTVSISVTCAIDMCDLFYGCMLSAPNPPRLKTCFAPAFPPNILTTFISFHVLMFAAASKFEAIGAHMWLCVLITLCFHFLHFQLLLPSHSGNFSSTY